MRFYARLNGDDVVGLVRFDPDRMMTSYFKRDEQQWVDDIEDMDIVLGRNTEAREVTPAEAAEIHQSLLASSAAPTE